MNAPSTSRLVRWFDWACWLAVAMSMLLAIAACGRFVTLRIKLSQISAPHYHAGASPRVAVAANRVEFEKTKLETLQLSHGIQNVPQALANLLAADSPDEARAVDAFLSRVEIAPHERRLTVEVLLSDRVSPTSARLAILEKYGEPTDAPKLARKTPPAQRIGEWLDLLAKWGAAPEPSIVTFLLKDESRAAPCAEALAARDMHLHAAVIECLAGAEMPADARVILIDKLSPSDRRALAALTTLAAREPLSESIAAELKSNPPSSEIARRFLPAFEEASKSSASGGFEFIERLVPALFAFDDPEYWNWLAQKLRTPPGREPNPDSLRVFAAIVWRFEGTPLSGAADVLASARSGIGGAVVWPVADLLARRPEFRDLIKIPEPKVNPAPMATATSAAVDAKQIDAALASLKSADSQKVADAHKALASTTVDEARRTEVIDALVAADTGELFSDRAALLAYCRWAPSSQQTLVAHFAIAGGDDEIRSEALRNLLAVASDRLDEVAAAHLQTSGWTDKLIETWSASGAAGEAALCRAMARHGIPGINRHAVRSLARCGGEPALRLLQVFLDEMNDAGGAEASAAASNDRAARRRAFGPAQREAVATAIDQLKFRLEEAAKAKPAVERDP